ncbi:(E)-4-hydroxy-3-methylbut-2-enyl-diphosphate synthase [Dyadobacter chenwenxiniae]|uniref:4-hydroxy-3-methylbut-2-en-1-yl diphosphate synthase (flavodoxin) n=1 Tax=Dyadobacter chenwenxiniae TaxID=2906456 RepID=A0A9X1TFA6_9BACT|nr:(E)-4-hydroxy-3-methylbut-2-enyl-diphosphate synthase [Dyadobacter chenwenxiniae]MCF0062772.1 (E)-4-hydroxy-3-methylbut-2-enyl-diphosphate synthase [Dyadobacter chenwenxiniae]UON85052.1 (E)-4-hydroxy-3-methylbut-2-enyl-diphosphate synthase [Dyadobacter chenwenxiniae]
MAVVTASEKTTNLYCPSLTAYNRRKTITINIGDLPMGSDYPIRVQSMTTVDTMDTQGSIDEVIRMVDSGCEYVRITAPSVKEAQNLENIRNGLRKLGINVPLIADIHFTPNAAELAARIVEKVRINPGNYADRKRFEIIDYTDASYAAELERIREKFIPLVRICKEYGTAMRIGTNHGSLSDRILSRYGDTPLGMVESALEFLRICEEFNYFNIALSMKSSNTQVMVEAYRLLVQRLDEEGLKPYPLHLGVTEAGEAEDGRIKSAVGIGTLLEDGLGDTVRVSLTEAPEKEAPVARALIQRYANRTPHGYIEPVESCPINPFQYTRRDTKEVYNIGHLNVPRVIADYSNIHVTQLEDLKSVGHFFLPVPDKWAMNDQGADFIYSGKNPAPFMLPNGLREILDFEQWLTHENAVNKFPLFEAGEWLEIDKTSVSPQLNFIKGTIHSLDDLLLESIRLATNVVLLIHTDNAHAMPELRRFFYKLVEKGIKVPVVVQCDYASDLGDELTLYSATDIGGLLVDGFGDGVLLQPSFPTHITHADMLKSAASFNSIAFGILQAARTRMSKTEYISCPSCGRTLFDLQETTAMIRKHTEHLKGVKIGIMGCIVNGPGEMADADYGYVGMGKDKIALYRGQEVIKRSVTAARAVEELIGLIREDGRWIEPDEREILV